LIGIIDDGSTIVSDSNASYNGGDGISSYTIVNSQANNSGGFGIQSSGFVTGSVARGNALGGINGGGGSVMNSTASGNSDGGIVIVVGIATATIEAGSVTGSISSNNGGRGISLACPLAAFGNTALNNSGGNLVTSDNTCVPLDNNAP